MRCIPVKDIRLMRLGLIRVLVTWLKCKCNGLTINSDTVNLWPMKTVDSARFDGN